MKENAIFLSSAMSKGFAAISATTQHPTPPAAPAVDAQEIQSAYYGSFFSCAYPDPIKSLKSRHWHKLNCLHLTHFSP